MQYAQDESLTKRQQTMKEIEDLWWKQWIVQVFPSLVPYKKWRVEQRNVQQGDIVMVLYTKKIGKGEYRLGRILEAYKDKHGVVRTVKVGLRRRDQREDARSYVAKPLDEIEIGVQRLAVICPAEEQVGEQFDGGRV